MKTQRLFMTICLTSTIVMLIPWNETPTIAQSGVLDGKTFAGEVGEKGKKNGESHKLGKEGFVDH